jgi:hypothetical protein
LSACDRRGPGAAAPGEKNPSLARQIVTHFNPKDPRGRPTTKKSLAILPDRSRTPWREPSIGGSDRSIGRNDRLLPRNDRSIGENDRLLPRNDRSIGGNDRLIGQRASIIPTDRTIIPTDDRLLPRRI